MPKIIQTPITFSQHMVNHVTSHPLVFGILLVLCVLLALISGKLSDEHQAKKAYKNAQRQANRQQKHANRLAKRQQKRDNKYVINVIDDILALIDQRVPADPNPNELLRFKNTYLIVRDELGNGQTVDQPLDQILYEYYQMYNNDQSSQLVQQMRLVNRYLGFQY